MDETLLQPLHALRRRERAIAAAWGFARLTAVVACGLALACWVDWSIDRRHDTPFALRAGMLAGQALAAGIAGWLFLGPAFRHLADDELALFVEERQPGLRHRLISAVQFQRDPARVRGMSADLIAQTTREARHAVRGIRFPALADHSRLRKAGWLGLGLLLLGSLALAVAPATVTALVARQALLDVAIPRNNALTNLTAAVQPAAEPVTLRFKVDGPPPTQGEIRVAPDGASPERVVQPLTLSEGVWTVSHPPPAGDFVVEAWVGDARLRDPARVRLVPRPAVTRIDATLILPEWVGRTPAGGRYEQPQLRGEIVGIDGAAARVRVQTQKPVVKAELDLIGLAEGPRPAPVTRTLAPVVAGESEFTFEFPLAEGESAYRVRVTDEHGFANADPPRREIRLVPVEPPTVTLLAETFKPEGFVGNSEDFEADGVPVPLGGPVRIAYTCQHPFGLGRAALVYRVNEGEWRRLGLTEVNPTPATGPFDPRRGCFRNSRPSDQVQFTAVPAADPTTTPGRLDGGGRFDFQTRGLPGLKVGDQIEYFIEVTTRHPDASIVGRSETRSKRVVTVTELVEWIDATLRQEDRIRRLADRQRGVFDTQPKTRP
jgi:hypothetical protein